MKLLTFLSFLFIFISCGKDSKSGQIAESSSSTLFDAAGNPTPGGNQGEGEGDAGNQGGEYSGNINIPTYQIQSDKSHYEKDETIILTLKNLGVTSLLYSSFDLSVEGEVQIMQTNCERFLRPNKPCSLEIRIFGFIPGLQKLLVKYTSQYTVETEVSFFLEEGTPADTQLLGGLHTVEDCQRTSELDAFGFFKESEGSLFCSFRSVHFNFEEEVEIVENPIDSILSETERNERYCPAGWTIKLFEMQHAVVKEVKNRFGIKRKVTIPAGESKELCTKRNFLSGRCTEYKTFYSRLKRVLCH
jgi:hypothetical protein